MEFSPPSRLEGCFSNGNSQSSIANIQNSSQEYAEDPVSPIRTPVTRSMLMPIRGTSTALSWTPDPCLPVGSCRIDSPVRPSGIREGNHTRTCAGTRFKCLASRKPTIAQLVNHSNYMILRLRHALTSSLIVI